MARKDWKEKQAGIRAADEMLSKRYSFMEHNWRNDHAKEEFHRPPYGKISHVRKDDTNEETV